MDKAGLSYSDWRQMVRWQRLDYLARYQLQGKAMAERVKDGKLASFAGVLIERLLRL